jgi:glycosyltransferase involved in cell wall biosynthesis
MNWYTLPSERVINISLAAPEYFRPMELTGDRASSIRQRYGVTRPFVLYAGSTGSYDGLNSLVHAYASLDEAVRGMHQVLITGITQNEAVSRVRQQLEQLGLTRDEIVFAPPTPNSELCALYNLASAFCLPGLGSGFGVTALEAMKCGTATVGANLPGLSEIIGRTDALFDATRKGDFAARLHQVLVDEAYRRSLSEHGLNQAQKFTWDVCARRAWDAFEAANERKSTSEGSAVRLDSSASPPPMRLRLAYVSPLVAEREEKDFQSAKLIPELSRHYEIDVISDQSEIADLSVEVDRTVRSFDWFASNAWQYDRLLYYIDDSQFYSRIRDLVLRHPGVVILHNFSTGDVSDDQDSNTINPVALDRELYYARRYKALTDKAHDKSTIRSHRVNPIDVSILQSATGVILSNGEVKDWAPAYFSEQPDIEWTAILSRRSSGDAEFYVSPSELADQYFAAIESFSRRGAKALSAQAVAAVTAVDADYENEKDWLSAARAIAHNLPATGTVHQLLVDISELVQRDVGTGIQRVTRSILKELLVNPPKGYRVEPVYAQPNKLGYRYARNFTLRFLNQPTTQLNDAVVETRSGDIYLGLDLQRDVVAAQQEFYSSMRRRGGRVDFVIYDLLPVLLPHAFPDGTVDQHTRWLSVLARHSDSLICISRSVADELVTWLNAEGPQTRLRPLRIGWFHLGADIDMSVPSRGIPNQGKEILTSLIARPSFLAVGTIEPRKGYAQLLEAFDQLWTQGIDVSLTIVGKQGWNVDKTAEAMRRHPEFGKRLLWLEGISDEYLEKIYSVSVCLIAASEGEGFGLPLIEAARHRIPILARDIPVFHEVAGEHVSYFSGRDPSDLAHAVQQWLVLYGAGQHPRSDNMPWLTWTESADRLKELLLQNSWYKTWSNDQRSEGLLLAGQTTESQNTERAEIFPVVDHAASQTLAKS